MPWRDDFVEAGWLDPDFGLAGYPSQAGTAEPERQEDTEPKSTVPVNDDDLIPFDQVPPDISTLPDPKWPSPWREPSTAVLVLRDRIGFRYERLVGLRDLVSQREAAQLLGIPKMTINRWVRRKRLPSERKHGHCVVRLHHVLRVAKDRSLPIKMVGRFMGLSKDNIDQDWFKSDEVQYEQSD